MSVHHIKPHVINSSNNNNNNNNNNSFNSNHNFNNDNPFGFNNLNNLFKQMGQLNHISTNSNNPNVHSFSSTVTNNNGHVTKHVNVDGHQATGKNADELLKKLHSQQHHAQHSFLGHFKTKDNHNLFSRLGFKKHKNK